MKNFRFRQTLLCEKAQNLRKRFQEIEKYRNYLAVREKTCNFAHNIDYYKPIWQKITSE